MSMQHDAAPAVGEWQGSVSALLAALPDMVIVLDSETRVIFANQLCRDLLLWGDDQLGQAALSFVHPDDIASVASSMVTIRGKAVGSPIELRLRDATGAWHWVELIGSDQNDNPGIRGYVCVARDITQRRKWEVGGGDTAQLQHVLQHGSSISLLLDRHGAITSANNALNRILGHDKSVVIGATLVDLADPESRQPVRRAIDECVATGHPTAVEALMRHADEQRAPCPILFELRNLLTDPVLEGIVVSGHDITEPFRARRSLERLAHFDGLTGVANRTLLIGSLDQWIADDTPVTTFFIDLDRFKVVNDRLGHHAGDRLLEMVAGRLANAVRPDDVLARFGGDEFVVAAPGVTSEVDISAMAERLAHAFDDEFTIEDQRVAISGSIGYATSTPGSTPMSLLRAADASMYIAKQRIVDGDQPG